MRHSRKSVKYGPRYGLVVHCSDGKTNTDEVEVIKMKCCFAAFAEVVVMLSEDSVTPRRDR